mmetsp:Transcript_23006/g.64108  ORF Transcript_23006/g.64108 Transcript_23006/m.64108 type:complete len:158 (+) Transcript_23006:359-832(+)
MRLHHQRFSLFTHSLETNPFDSIATTQMQVKSASCAVCRVGGCAANCFDHAICIPHRSTLRPWQHVATHTRTNGTGGNDADADGRMESNAPESVVDALGVMHISQLSSTALHTRMVPHNADTTPHTTDTVLFVLFSPCFHERGRHAIVNLSAHRSEM